MNYRRESSEAEVRLLAGTMFFRRVFPARSGQTRQSGHAGVRAPGMEAGRAGSHAWLAVSLTHEAVLNY